MQGAVQVGRVSFCVDPKKPASHSNAQPRKRGGRSAPNVPVSGMYRPNLQTHVIEPCSTRTEEPGWDPNSFMLRRAVADGPTYNAAADGAVLLWMLHISI